MQPSEPGFSGLPSAVAHQPGGMAEAVWLAGCDGVVEQAARAPALRMPRVKARIVIASTV